MQSSAALPAQLSRMGVRCLSSVQSSLLGDFQLLGVHDTALVRPPKPVADLVLHLRPSVARPLVIDAAAVCLLSPGSYSNACLSRSWSG